MQFIADIIKLNSPILAALAFVFWNLKSDNWKLEKRLIQIETQFKDKFNND